jgi:hypothetical protein
MKKFFFTVLILAAFSIPLLSLNVEGQQGHKSKTGADSTPAYPAMAGPGKQVPIGNDQYLIYSFDKKPKLGTVIMKVEIFSKNGKKDTSFEVKGDSGMPSMRGAHESGEQPFKLSNKGDYLLPINIVMPGGWEVRLTLAKDGKVIFRGSYQFDV